MISSGEPVFATWVGEDGYLDKSEGWMDSAVLYIWISFGVIIFSAILVLPFVAGIAMAMRGKFSARLVWWLSRIFLPLINLLAIAFLVVTAVFSGVTALSTDICASQGSPATVVYNWFLNLDGNSNSTARRHLQTADFSDADVLEYYSFCSPDTPAFYAEFVNGTKIELLDAASEINGAANALQAQLAAFEVDMTAFNVTYDMTTCNAMIPALGAIETNILLLPLAIQSAADAFGCENFTPYYYALLNDTTCTGIASSVIWAFFACTVYVFSVLMMNTTRRGYLDDVIASPDGPKSPAGFSPRNSGVHDLEGARYAVSPTQDTRMANSNSVDKANVGRRSPTVSGHSDEEGETFRIDDDVRGTQGWR